MPPRSRNRRLADSNDMPARDAASGIEHPDRIASQNNRSNSRGKRGRIPTPHSGQGVATTPRTRRLAENNIPAPEALEVLSAAASEAGLGEREITATVRSAYRTVQPRPQTSSRGQVSSAPSPCVWFSRDASVRASPALRGLS